MAKHLLIVISGPSGVGKGEVVKKLIAKGGYALSVSCTTRQPRSGEVEGVSYFFISREEFERQVAAGGFLEYARHFESCYGTPRKFVEERLEESDVILEIDVDGALQVKNSYPEALLIMLVPPDMQTLEYRLRNRGSESEEKIAKRLSRVSYELSLKDKYDYVVVNGELPVAVRQIEKIIEGERRK